jgi:hypothetical protein
MFQVSRAEKVLLDTTNHFVVMVNFLSQSKKKMRTKHLKASKVNIYFAVNRLPLPMFSLYSA